jgi:hypothetical protein
VRPLLLLLVFVGCADDKLPCGEGLGRTSVGDCVPLDMGVPDTGSSNTPPTAPGVRLVPEAPRSGGADLQCLVDVEAFDVDGDSLSTRISWWVDGTLYREALTTALEGDTIAGSELEQGALWRCEARSSDLVSEGPAGEASVKIGSGYQGWEEQHISLERSDYLLHGEAPGDGAGGFVAPAGDVDGDGLADVIIAAYWSDAGGPDSGKGYLVLGADLGAERQISLSDAAWGFVGEHGRIEDDPDCDLVVSEDLPCGGDWAGHSLNSPGDVDGDGLSDIAISGYLSDQGGHNAGKTYILLGASLGGRGTMSLEGADHVFVGEGRQDRLGHSIHGAGDVDGDGLQDIVTGAYGFDGVGEESGKVYVVLASSLLGRPELQFPEDSDFSWEGEAAGDEAGYLHSPAGDLDGDGLGDFMTTAQRNQEGGVGLAPSGEHGAGKIYVFMGGDLDLGEVGSTYSLADVDRAWLGETGDDAVGYGTNGVGDFDGDGVDDVMTASYANNEGGENAGKTYVMTGASMGSPGTRSLSEAAYGFTGASAGDWSGFGAGPAGDFDRDGLADIIIGGMWHTGSMLGQGAGYLVLSGSLSGPGTYSLNDADHIFAGEAELDTAGYKLAGTGDMNGDGMPDLMVSGWQGNVPEEGGKVWLLMNPN